VVQIRKGSAGVREASSLFEALAGLDMPLTPVPCGGERRTMQEREQWASGCNFFAVAPGQVLAYGRNERTLRALEREGGLGVVRGVDFLTGDVPVGPEDRVAISFEGSELVRGGGGPRCMTMPVRREELA
jgi:arginine deiminase